MLRSRSFNRLTFRPDEEEEIRLRLVIKPLIEFSVADQHLENFQQSVGEKY